MSVLSNHQLGELITIWPCSAGFYGTERNRFQIVPEDRGFAGVMTIFSLVNTRHSINICWMNEQKDKFKQTLLSLYITQVWSELKLGIKHPFDK